MRYVEHPKGEGVAVLRRRGCCVSLHKQVFDPSLPLHIPIDRSSLHRVTAIPVQVLMMIFLMNRLQGALAVRSNGPIS